MELNTYGIIPVKQIEGVWHLFVIQHASGYWGLPKGLPEEGETPEGTARRELEEETGLRVVEFYNEPPFVDQYACEYDGVPYEKTVYYYLARVEGEVSLQEEEVADGKWVPCGDAGEVLTYPSTCGICERACAGL